MAFLAAAGRAAMGAARSGIMRGGAGDSALFKGGEGDAKEVKKVLEDVKSGKMSVGSLDSDILKKLGGKEGIAKFINGEGGALDRFVGKSRGFEQFGIKPIDVSRKEFNEKNGIEPGDKDASDKKSSKSKINGSLDAFKARFYDRTLFNTENIDPVPTYTPKPGPGEVRPEGSPLEGDIRNLRQDVRQGLKELEKDVKKLIKDVEKGMGKEFGSEFGKNLENIEKDVDRIIKNVENGKDFKKDLNDLERDTGKLEKDLERGTGKLERYLEKDEGRLEKDLGEKEDIGENEFSIDSKSFFHKLKDVTETLKQYERMVGDEDAVEAIDNLQIAEGLGNGLGTDSAGSQRINRNIASQNTKKGGVRHGSFSQTHTGSGSGGHNPGGGGPIRSSQRSKAGRYDPYRRKVSGDGLGKPLDPFREKLKSLQEFYDKHEKKFDMLDSANQQLNQAASNLDDVIGGALMAYARKKLEEGLGENVPVGDGGSQNANNNNNNDSNSFIKGKVKEKLGFGEKKEHKSTKMSEGVISGKAGKKGSSSIKGKEGVKKLEGVRGNHAAGKLKDTKKGGNKVEDLFRAMHDLKENNPYVKFASDTSGQLRTVQDPAGEILKKLAAESGAEVPSGDNANQQNNSSIGMDSVFSSKDHKESKIPKAGNKRSKLESHTNSKRLKVEHHTDVSVLDRNGHNTGVKPFKGDTERHTHERADLFSRGVDQAHHDPSKNANQIFEHKQDPKKVEGPNNKHKVIEAEAALEIEREENKAMGEHDIEKAIDTVMTIRDIGEIFKRDDNKDQDEQKDRKTEKDGRSDVIEYLAPRNDVNVIEEEREGQRREVREEARKQIQEERERREEEGEGQRQKVREEAMGQIQKEGEREEEEGEEQRQEVMKETREQRQVVRELEEILQTRLGEMQGEAQLRVKPTDQVNRNVAYSEQLQGEIAEREVAGPKIEARIEAVEGKIQANEGLMVQQDSGKKAGEVVRLDEIEARVEGIGRQLEADEGLVKQDGEEEKKVAIAVKNDTTTKLETIVQTDEVRVIRENREGKRENRVEVVGSEDVTAKLERIVPADEGRVRRTDKDELAVQEFSQSSRPAELELEKVKATVDEVREPQGEDVLQTQTNNLGTFLTEKAGRGIGNVEASVYREAMLPSDSEVSRRSLLSLIKDKGPAVMHNSAEAMHHIEQHLNTNVEGHEKQDFENVKLEDEQRTYSASARVRSGEVPAEQKESNLRTLEKRSLGQEEQVVETESVTNRAAPVSEISEITEIGVIDSVSDKNPEIHRRQRKNDNLDTIEQLESSEDENALEAIGINRQRHLQDNRNVDSNQKAKNERNLEEARNLKLESAEPVKEESEAEKAARLERDNFISLFTSVAKPGLQTEIARNFGENAYREAKVGKEDIGELTRNIVKNSEKLTKDFTTYLQVEERRLEAENNLNKQWENEASVRKDIPAH